MRHHQLSLSIGALLVVIFLTGFSRHVIAHPGRTDSQGGHYNRKTGEYHFHDGSSRSGSGSYSDNYTRTPYPDVVLEPKPTSRPATSKTKASNEPSILFQTIAVILVASFAIPVALFTYGWLAEWWDFRRKRKMYLALYKGKCPGELVDFPRHTEIGADGLPKDARCKGWGESHTVYVSRSRTKYHRQSCQYAHRKMHACHAYGREPCKVCRPPLLPDYSWFREYQKIVEIKRRYKID